MRLTLWLRKGRLMQLKPSVSRTKSSSKVGKPKRRETDSMPKLLLNKTRRDYLRLNPLHLIAKTSLIGI